MLILFIKSFCLSALKMLSEQDAKDDRLSSFPDDLIHKILSFISIKDVIRTSVLSSRWKNIWTSTPYLNFENQPHLSEFISDVLSHRNNQIQVSSIDLVLERTLEDDESVIRVLDYTFSHNVQQLSITRSPGNILECPYSFIATPTWDLPALTTLQLHHVKLFDDNDSLFSKCTNLKNLFLRKCSMKGSKVLEICHPRLSNLTLQYTELEEVVNVVAPQLKNLTIQWCKGKHRISAPGLTSLLIEGSPPWHLSTPAGFCSLDKVELFMFDAHKAYAHEVVSLLQQFHSVKLLTVNLGILKRLFINRKRLSSSMKLIPHKACVFSNAKILHFSTKPLIEVYLEVGAQDKVTTTSTGIKFYDTSPSAIFPMVSREEITAIGDMELAQVYVEQLRRLVNHRKANTSSDKAHMDEHSKPLVEMHWALELQRNLGEMMALIRDNRFVELETCSMMLQIKRKYAGTSETHFIIPWLRKMLALFDCIEQLITQQLSASKRAVMLPIFLSLCEDAAILAINLLGWIKIKLPNALLI